MNKSLAALLLVSSVAHLSVHAGERREVVSRVWALDKSRSVEVDTEHKFYAIVSEEVVLVDSLSGSHPFKKLTGTCVGWLERRPGSRKGNGECVYANPTGGKWQLTWDLDTDDGGNYSVKGIQGDASGWKGAGRWHIEAEFSQDRSVQTWTGWIE